MEDGVRIERIIKFNYSMSANSSFRFHFPKAIVPYTHSVNTTNRYNSLTGNAN